jgi:hypothetical protein
MSEDKGAPSSKRRMSADDRLDIMELFARYSWAYDCSDAAAYSATFAPDGVLEAFGGEAARGREAIATFVAALIASERGDNDWQHYNGHFVFEAGADEDSCTVYNYWNLLQSKDGPSVRSFGYYVSDCVRIGGEWLLKRRGINRWDRTKLPWS